MELNPAFDILIVGGRLWSDGASLPSDAVGLRAGRIAAIGDSRELDPRAGSETLRLDARGASVTPGITDAHLHLLSWSRSRRELLLAGARSAEEVAARVAERATIQTSGTLIGRGWDADSWSDAPHRSLLDRACPDRPVFLHSKDFHAVWVNGAALARAGVDDATPEPSGGRLERDAAGRLTGVAREHAVRLFLDLARESDHGDDFEGLDESAAFLHQEGITAVHNFEGVEERGILWAWNERSPRLRLLHHLPHAELDRALEQGVRSGQGDDWRRLGAVKLFADGTLGSRTAAMLEPYDGTAERGMSLLPGPELRETVRRALDGGLAVAIHAIGDRAVRESLDAFESSGTALRGPELGSRIEHAQLVHPLDLPRFGTLGVAASMQPIHATADRDLAERWWASRLEHAYPWRSLLARGALLAFGSDAPVEAPEVAAALHAAVTRQRPDEQAQRAPFVPGERLDLDQALTALTEGPARLAGWWPRCGRIAPGAKADLVVWDRDLHTTPADRLHEARPAFTLLEGRVVYAAGERSATAVAHAKRGP